MHHHTDSTEPQACCTNCNKTFRPLRTVQSVALSLLGKAKATCNHCGQTDWHPRAEFVPQFEERPEMATNF